MKHIVSGYFDYIELHYNICNMHFVSLVWTRN